MMQGESVLWHRCVGTGRRDPYNRKVREFAPPEEIRNVLVAPGSSSEPGSPITRIAIHVITLTAHCYLIQRTNTRIRSQK